jgi:LuxR family transcriptional regulator, quorum-sensing system regulator BjaR1
MEFSLSTSLTPREAEVLGLVAQGYHYEDVAAQLCISPHTVDTHMRSVRLKLGVTTTIHAVFLVFSATSASFNP